MSHYPFYYNRYDQYYGTYRRTTPATTLAVTLADAKAHLRIDGSDEDDLVTGLIKAATLAAESYIEQSILTQEWTVYYDRFPNIITLKYGPVTGVTTFSYVDEDEVTQTLTLGTDFRVDLNSKLARVYSIDGWPSVHSEIKGGVQVLYTGGMGAVPEDIQQGILMHVGHMYENRQDVVTGTMVNKVPMASQFLYDPYKQYLYA